MSLSVLASDRFTRRTGSCTDAQPVKALLAWVAGGTGAGQADALADVGKPGLIGSPPPPTAARLTTELLAEAEIVTSNEIDADAAGASGVVLLQVTTPAACEQLKPPVVVKPVAKLRSTGSTSTTRKLPLVGWEPMLVTVRL